MFRSPVLPEILSLDPQRDNQRIVFLCTRIDFPFDTVRALELALFRTFGSPRISSLLDRTGAFAHAAQKRYDDTDIIISEIMDFGYDSPRGLAAIRRMNQLHGRFDIPNEDFLYVLSTFILEPIRFNHQFGWRELTSHERLAMFYFWREVGHRMGIRDIPATFESFESFSQDYESRYFVPDPSNNRVGAATRGVFESWFPRPLRPLVRASIHALLDDAILGAFIFPRPSCLTRALLTAPLKLRSLLLRFLPRRQKPLPPHLPHPPHLSIRLSSQHPRPTRPNATTPPILIDCAASTTRFTRCPIPNPKAPPHFQ